MNSLFSTESHIQRYVDHTAQVSIRYAASIAGITGTIELPGPGLVSRASQRRVAEARIYSAQQIAPVT